MKALVDDGMQINHACKKLGVKPNNYSVWNLRNTTKTTTKKTPLDTNKVTTGNTYIIFTPDINNIRNLGSVLRSLT